MQQLQDSTNVRCLLGAGLVDSFEYHAVILALDLAILTPNPRPAPNVHQYGEYHLRLGDAWMSRSPNRPTTPYHDPRYRYARIPSVSSTFQFRTDEPSDYIIAPLAVPEVASTVFMRPSPRATDRLEDRPGPVMFASRSLFTAFRWFCASGFRSGCWRSHLLARPSNSHNPDRGMKSKGVLMGSTDGRVFLCQYLSRTGDSIVEFCSRSGRKRITTISPKCPLCAPCRIPDGRRSLTVLPPGFADLATPGFWGGILTSSDAVPSPGQ
ncbi:hypothetical protein KC343_g3 [Hortaea werneckii]|nr:hypothetical protein KC346_g3 [Hortaea werneckii]KAI7638493.1 hypothetical protein KC343_g3 [Hortaea werneckii]